MLNSQDLVRLYSVMTVLHGTRVFGKLFGRSVSVLKWIKETTTQYECMLDCTSLSNNQHRHY